jgi:hypothetical protein
MFATQARAVSHHRDRIHAPKALPVPGSRAPVSRDSTAAILLLPYRPGPPSIRVDHTRQPDCDADGAKSSGCTGLVSTGLALNAQPLHGVFTFSGRDERGTSQCPRVAAPTFAFTCALPYGDETAVYDWLLVAIWSVRVRVSLRAQTEKSTRGLAELRTTFAPRSKVAAVGIRRQDLLSERRRQTLLFGPARSTNDSIPTTLAKWPWQRRPLSAIG